MRVYSTEQMKQMVLQHVRQDSSKRFIGTIYQDMECLDSVIDYLAGAFRGKVEAVAAPATAGYILGSMLARELKVPFIPIIKGGNAEEQDAEEYIRSSYLDHRNSVRSMKVRKDAVQKGQKILLVDNWIETAATITTCLTLLEEAETSVRGIAAFGLDYNDATAKLIRSFDVRVVVNE
ncbi:MAG: phosphoribosyltransferase family protein [Lachnospiraceae bacterium]|nr:phosphoribosyltransferase family protein [Lachnospiraceae bacterium]